MFNTNKSQSLKAKTLKTNIFKDKSIKKRRRDLIKEYRESHTPRNLEFINNFKRMPKVIMATVVLMLSPLTTAVEANQANERANHSLVRSYSDVQNVPASIRQKTTVAISNYPLFLLSEAVTKGAPSGKLLLSQGDVGHHGSLSPAGIKTIKDSRYVVWFGRQLESNLAGQMAKNNNSISLFDLDGFNYKPLRDVKGKPIEGTLDPHIWLDPENAKAITRALGAIYSRANPEYKHVYERNVKEFAKSMNAAHQSIKNTEGVLNKNRDYWAYHDAFAYIEPALNLNMAGALTADHHLPPKASQFFWLNKTRPNQTMCIVLQSDSNKGVLSKLKPIKSIVEQEDMSDATDFVTGWLAMAKRINNCVKAAS